MTSPLQEALGALARWDEGRGLVLEPTSERELITALHVLADRGAALHRDVTLSRARLNELGHVEPQAMTVTVGAGVRLQHLEDRLRTFGLTLGPLSAHALTLTLAEFLEGPHAGLRAIPGGRLERICTQVSGVLPDGRRLQTSKAPRSATGPDLAQLLLGADGRLGLVTSAVVRCFAAPTQEGRSVVQLPSARHFVDAVTQAVACGAWLASVRAHLHGGQVLAELVWTSSDAGAERERALVATCVAEAGGHLVTATVPLVEKAPEREVMWDEVRAAVSAGALVQLSRIALASVVATGVAQGVSLDERGPWDPLSPRLLSLDPNGVLGGAW